ncbi:hypothetical protein [Ruminococcus sp. XPD3002]|uniref:hypothetical protein n=1 Tax=Ruminococcus sp. XPD3002 TaxID=1452269 RepID=UPI0009233832|nr:hypothetical protein SAMN04487832_11635 [Ruminococcus flavefaciens]
MKNPMIENNINTDLFEAIDENAVNGGRSIAMFSCPALACAIRISVNICPAVGTAAVAVAGAVAAGVAGVVKKK